RGLNENTNGLVRQYFPKKYEFARIKTKDLQQVEDLLNNRPRKTLGYRPPNEVFFKQRSVALPS
ncbi:MAG TPA: IS30 family transposase, partial [Pyrinomonadaceae bacterium]